MILAGLIILGVGGLLALLIIVGLFYLGSIDDESDLSNLD